MRPRTRIEAFGVVRTAEAWASLTPGLTAHTILERIHKGPDEGWTAERAVSEPPSLQSSHRARIAATFEAEAQRALQLRGHAPIKPSGKGRSRPVRVEAADGSIKTATHADLVQGLLLREGITAHVDKRRRPDVVRCLECGVDVPVSSRGVIPTQCSACRRGIVRTRPTTIACSKCGDPVAVPSRGQVPKQCPDCRDGKKGHFCSEPGCGAKITAQSKTGLCYAHAIAQVHAAKTREERSTTARAAQAAKSPEERSAAAKKAHRTRRARS